MMKAYNRLYHFGKPVGTMYVAGKKKEGESTASFKARVNKENNAWNKKAIKRGYTTHLQKVGNCAYPKKRSGNAYEAFKHSNSRFRVPKLDFGFGF